MATKAELQQRKEDLLRILQKQKDISRVEIKERYGIKDTAMKGLLEALRKEGFPIIDTRKGYVGFDPARLPSEDQKNPYKPSSIADTKALAQLERFQIFLSEEEAFSLLDHLEAYADESPYAKELEKIREELHFLLFKTGYQDKAASITFDTLGKIYQIDQALLQRMTEFLKLPYQTQVLDIKYRAHSGRELHIRFSTGIFLYSIEKAAIYLIGSDGTSKNVTLAFDSILAASETDETHTLFQNDYYRQLFDTMFYVSPAPAESVVVEFKDEFNIHEKLQRLLKTRSKTATLTKENGILLYRDQISGMEDFAQYLRRFGSSCKVLEPQSLVKRMQRSAKNILHAYKEEGLYDETVE